MHDVCSLKASERLRALEESLWRPERRFERAWMERLLAEDFVEFGRSGRAFDRVAILRDTGAPRPIEARLPLPDFASRALAPKVALVTYVSEMRRDGAVDRAWRASIWRRVEERWLLCFHQGTPIPAPTAP